MFKTNKVNQKSFVFTLTLEKNEISENFFFETNNLVSLFKVFKLKNL